jgi:hypothetical protein
MHRPKLTAITPVHQALQTWELRYEGTVPVVRHTPIVGLSLADADDEEQVHYLVHDRDLRLPLPLVEYEELLSPDVYLFAVLPVGEEPTDEERGDAREQLDRNIAEWRERIETRRRSRAA